MKHTLKVTLILILVFFAAQIVGLGVTNQYIDHVQTVEAGEVVFKALPYNITRPEVDQTYSFVWIFIAIIIGTLLVFLLIKYRKPKVWRVWFLLSVVVTMAFSLSAFIHYVIATILSVIFGIWKVYRPNIYIHNFTEIFIYGGLAAIFVPMLNIFAAFALLILISIYDIYAVWKSKHMVTLAKFQTKSKVFAGLMIPYGKLPKVKKTGKPKKTVVKKIRTAVLGGGDIGFPLIFIGVVMKDLMLKVPEFQGFLLASIIAVCATVALFILLIKAKKDKFYPAMPFITAGCVVGYLIVQGILLL